MSTEKYADGHSDCFLKQTPEQIIFWLCKIAAFPSSAFPYSNPLHIDYIVLNISHCSPLLGSFISTQ